LHFVEVLHRGIFLTDVIIFFNYQDNPVPGMKDKKVGIHRGFYDYLFKENKKKKEAEYTEILGHVTNLFQKDTYSGYKLYVTGHSMGGALATLFSFYVAAKSYSQVKQGNTPSIPFPVTCVSFASPRVGESGFLRAFQTLEQEGMLRHLRIVNDQDPVPVVPISSRRGLLSRLKEKGLVEQGLVEKGSEEKGSEKSLISSVEAVGLGSFLSVWSLIKLLSKETEIYRHTGIKLKMINGEEKDSHISWYSVNADKEIADLIKLTFSSNDPFFIKSHFISSYDESLLALKAKLSDLTLNDEYQQKATAVLALEGANLRAFSPKKDLF